MLIMLGLNTLIPTMAGFCIGQDKLDAVIGRKQEIERVTQILCKRRKNNPCLIGEPGVGKTVIAEGLAQRISYALVPPKLSGKKVSQQLIYTISLPEF